MDGKLCGGCNKIHYGKKKSGLCWQCEHRECGKQRTFIDCVKCGKSVSVSVNKVVMHLRKGGINCGECCRKMSSDTMKKTRSRQTPEERVLQSKLARAMCSKEVMSAAVTKQWAKIKADPEKFRQICDARSKRMERVWECYDDDTKNNIVNAFCKSYGKSRSASSDLLKQKMIDSGVYDGFVSEEVFHGFVPDEINHELKIIVEMYGDLYHCNPRKYKDENMFISAIKRTVGEQWKRDRKRLACFYKHGYIVVVVWDSDFRKHPDREIGRIKNEIDKKRSALGPIQQVGY